MDPEPHGLSLLVLRRDQRINCDLGQGLQLVPIETEAFFWVCFEGTWMSQELSKWL